MDVAALHYAETTLGEVHDGVVDSLVVVYDFVGVDSCDNVCRAVIFPMTSFSLLLSFRREPPSLLAKFVFELGDCFEEGYVAGAEEVEAAVYVDDSLTRARGVAGDHRCEGAFSMVVV